MPLLWTDAPAVTDEQESPLDRLRRLAGLAPLASLTPEPTTLPNVPDRPKPSALDTLSAAGQGAPIAAPGFSPGATDRSDPDYPGNAPAAPVPDLGPAVPDMAMPPHFIPPPAYNNPSGVRPTPGITTGPDQGDIMNHPEVLAAGLGAAGLIAGAPLALGGALALGGLGLAAGQAAPTIFQGKWNDQPPEPLFFPEKPDQALTALMRLGQAIPGGEGIWQAPEQLTQAAPLLRGTGSAALDRLVGGIDPATGQRYAQPGEGPLGVGGVPLPGGEPSPAASDLLLDRARSLAQANGGAVSAAQLQQELRVGYVQAARLVETLGDEGITVAPDAAYTPPAEIPPDVTAPEQPKQSLLQRLEASSGTAQPAAATPPTAPESASQAPWERTMAANAALPPEVRAARNAFYDASNARMQAVADGAPPEMLQALDQREQTARDAYVQAQVVARGETPPTAASPQEAPIAPTVPAPSAAEPPAAQPVEALPELPTATAEPAASAVEPPAPPAEPPSGGQPPEPPPGGGAIVPSGPDQPGSVTPSAAADNVLGLRPIETGLSKRQQLANRFKEAVGVGVPTEEHATPAFAERSRVQTTIGTQASTIAEQGAERVTRAFVTDKQGRIPALADAAAGLPDGPTVQDVAARLPTFADKLTPEQQAAMGWLKDTLAPYRQLWDEVGGRDLNTRADVMDGGFYLPRGRADVEGADGVLRPSGGGGRRGKAGFEKAATFDSQAQGIGEGYEYASLHDALQGYVKDVGSRIADQHIANYLKAATDENGKPLASTMADRVDPQLRDAVTGLRTKIAAQRNALIAQTVRERMAGQSADQIDRQVGRMVDLANNAQARYEARLAGANTDTVLAAAQRELSVLQQTANQANRTAGEAIGRAGKASDVRDTVTTAAEGGTLYPGPNATPGEVVAGAAARHDVLAEQALRDAKAADQAQARAVEAQAKFEDAKAKNRPDAVTKAAEREANVRQQQAEVTARQAETSRTKAEAYRTRADTTRATLDRLTSDMNDLKGRWQNAQDRARATPRGMGQVNMVELQGTAFPDALANAANQVLQSEGPPTGKWAGPIKVINALNNLYRGLGATLDNSALGIQGLLGLAGDHHAYGEALKVNAKAWGRGGDRALGAYLIQFDDAAKAAAQPTASDWGRAGLHVSGTASEFAVGPGIQALGHKLANAPGVVQAERAFGFFGDSLRLAWAQDEAAGLMRSGRTMEDLQKSGELERIASAVNGATGWSPNKAFGDLGDLALFAPRFLASRLETVARAAAGLRPGATVDQRIARNSMLKLIGGGVLLTVAANAARGKETDFRPLIPDGNGGMKRNTNFIRIRDLAGQDWSVFGTWDSLLGAFMDVATGHPDQALRGMSGGAVKIGWDLVTGKDSGGKSIYKDPATFAEWLASNFTPFGIQQLPGIAGSAVQSAQQGDYLQAAAAPGVAAAQMLGLKGSPLTPAERRGAIADDLTKQNAGKTVGTGEDAATLPADATTFAKLNVGQQRAMKLAFPKLKDAFDAAQAVNDQFAAAEPDPQKQLVRDAGIQYKDGVAKLETDAAKLIALAQEHGNGANLRKAIQDLKQNRYTVAQATLQSPKVLAARRPKDTTNQTVEDALGERYWSLNPIAADGVNLDYAVQQRQRAAILAVAKAQGVDPNYITGTGASSFRGQRFTDPGVRTAVEAYERAQEALRPYWEIKDTVAQRPAFAPVIAKYNAAVDQDARNKVMATPVYKLYEKIVTQQRQVFRRQNHTADLLLKKYGYETKTIDQLKSAGSGGGGITMHAMP